VHFPSCYANVGKAGVVVTPPCRDVCTEYCDECKLSPYCPCSDLPVKTTATNCSSLVSFCPKCVGTQASGSIPGRCVTNHTDPGQCAWSKIQQEVTQISSGASVTPGLASHTIGQSLAAMALVVLAWER
jgi:hypothetical protein